MQLELLVKVMLVVQVQAHGTLVVAVELAA